MALQFGQRIILLLFLFFTTRLAGQTVYYPNGASDLLISTAQDAAVLFTKISNKNILVQSYSSLPQAGIIFIYDSSVTQDGACKIESDGKTFIKFSASQDNGLCFGIYTYLNELGFRFYLPGTIWEKIPQINSVFKEINKTVSGKYLYNGWNVSGGHNRWAMDNNDAYGWDVLFGNNGHAWAKYQRRNNMLGAYRFTGHRGDIMNEEYLSFLRNNPCYVANNNGSRVAGNSSVPDINNSSAKKYWAEAIQSQFSKNKNSITGNIELYANQFRNFNYYNKNIGIEVPDGARWGNTTDNFCSPGQYPNESDQQFLLASFTAGKLSENFADKRFQCYAYSAHANIPSPSIGINKNIDVQVVASAFQFESSTKGLLSRWYKKHPNISEYNYVNIPQWTGETPLFSLNEYKNTLTRVKENNAQGLVTEASPAKFASLPFLFAGNRFLQNNIDVESSLDEFVSSMFPLDVAVHIKQLLQYWGDENVFSTGNFVSDNKNKIPLYLQQLDKAIKAFKKNDALVSARLHELKAYLHYIVLYFDFVSDPSSYQNKSYKAAALCLYLAQINRLQLVNSYFLILDIVNKYPVTHFINKEYNVATGTAYNNGSLALVTDKEIDENYNADMAKYANNISGYLFTNADEIIAKMRNGGLKPLDSINVNIRYTNGFDDPNRSEFYFSASSAGTVLIKYIPQFINSQKGFMNISVEDDNKPLFIIADETITATNNTGSIQIKVPYAGIFKLSFVSKYKTAAKITIITNGKTFFKKGAFYGDKVEDYSKDWNSLPKYFYVPGEIEKIYFSVNNSCYTGNCLNASGIKNAFAIKDGEGKDAIAQLNDDNFLYSIPTKNKSEFWQVTKMREYNLCFANISNIEIFAEKLQAEPAALPQVNSSVEVFPNPSPAIFNFSRNNLPLIFEKINVYNAMGKMVGSALNAGSINLSALPKGIYFYTGINQTESVKGKLIKN